MATPSGNLGQWSSDRLKAYTGQRPDIVSLIPPSEPILDIGCSSGALGRQIKQERGRNTTVWGIEMDPALAAEARKVLDEVVEGDAAEAIRQFASRDRRPAIVVLADVLEHVSDPWGLLDAVTDLLPDGGHVVLSVPNVGHWDTVAHILRGRWPVRDRGIHDVTHLRFFGRKDVEDLLRRGPLTPVRLERNLRLLERPSRVNRHVRFASWLRPDLFTFQFVGVARVDRTM